MRSGVVIGAAMAVLTVRLLAVDRGPEPATRHTAATAASAAASVLAEMARPAVSTNPSGLAAPVSASADAAPVTRAADGAAGVAATQPATARATAARHAMQAAAVEAQVRQYRARGGDEQAVYRLRAAQLPAADVAQLMAMEAAEAAWQRQRATTPADCTVPCSGATPEYVVSGAYRRDASPRLTLE